MKKTACLILAIVLMAVMIAGCAKSEAPAASDDKPSTGQTSDEPAVVDEGPEETDDSGGEEASEHPYPGAVGKKATVILKDLTNPVWIEASEGAKAAGEDFGMDVEVVAPIESNNNDEQIQLAQQVIAQQKDILIMCPADSTGIVPVIEEVNAANIPVINLNTRISKEVGNAQYETFVVADNTICATLCAEELVKLAGEKGKVLILEGPSGGQVTIDLSNGAQAVFNKYPDIEIVDIQDAKFDRSTAFNTVQNVLQAHPDIKIIFSCNDEMALGAIEALDEAGKLDDVVVGGIDGNQDALAAIKEGRMEVTVYKNFWLQAYTAVEAAAKFLDGQKLDELIPVDLEAVTKDNVDKYLKS
ncbi:MAG: sugar ABC transporter substrate-binding protein [Caldicoprobacterales bacterium]|jgi:ribose transport system substrate-binding protein